VLRELQEAGLDSLPGGGAEIFAERVRKKICDDKCGADRYLAIHRLAHGLGMRTNVTMLYGHIETYEERVDHMLRARALQDETGGLQAFIPLAFHPDNNQMRKLPAPSAIETLRVPRRVAPDARQRAAHQGVLDRHGSGNRPARAVVRRRRPRRHGAGRAHLPHGRIGARPRA
jgi:2-iminoacetate synthase ThiH